MSTSDLSAPTAATPAASPVTGTPQVKRGMAEMLKGGVIMDVVDAEQAKIAEDAGAAAVMALERVPADIRRDGGVARMSDPDMIEGHHGHGTGIFRDLGLFGGDHDHDDAALEHLRHAALDAGCAGRTQAVRTTDLCAGHENLTQNLGFIPPW